MATTLEVGKTYRVEHSRKGAFTATVKEISGEFADLHIVSGRARALLHFNEREAGEDVTVRISLCTFTPV